MMLEGRGKGRDESGGEVESAHAVRPEHPDAALARDAQHFFLQDAAFI